MSLRVPDRSAVGPIESPLQRALRIGHWLHEREREQAATDVVLNISNSNGWNTPQIHMKTQIKQIFRNRGVPVNSKIYMVDGSNIFFKNADGEKLVYEALMKNRNALAPCIVVSNLQAWDSIKNTYNYEKVKRTLRVLTGEQNPLIFCHVDVRSCDENKVNDTFCVDRNRANNTCTYKIKGHTSPTSKHLYCEFDDILLTKLHNTFKSDGYSVTVISEDQDVIKDDKAVDAVVTALIKMGKYVKLGLYHEDGTNMPAPMKPMDLAPRGPRDWTTLRR